MPPDPSNRDVLSDLSERVDPQQLHARAVIASRMLAAFISRGEYEEDVSAFLFERDRLRAEVERLQRARDADEIKAAVGHDPLTCELCHGEGVSAELVSLRAENERLRAGIVAIYRENAPLAAKACDEVIDRSGRLLGQVRTLARASDETDAPKGTK